MLIVTGRTHLCRFTPASQALVHAARACCTVSCGPRGTASGWPASEAAAAWQRRLRAAGCVRAERDAAGRCGARGTAAAVRRPAVALQRVAGATPAFVTTVDCMPAAPWLNSCAAW